MEAIKPMLNVSIHPVWRRSGCRILVLDVSFGEVTICYSTEAEPEWGEDPIYSALHGKLRVDEKGNAVNLGLSWDVDLEVEEGEDPFLSLARNYQTRREFSGTPWEAIEDASRLFASWLIQLEAAKLQKE